MSGVAMLRMEGWGSVRSAWRRLCCFLPGSVATSTAGAAGVATSNSSYTMDASFPRVCTSLIAKRHQSSKVL